MKFTVTGQIDNVPGSSVVVIAEQVDFIYENKDGSANFAMRSGKVIRTDLTVGVAEFQWQQAMGDTYLARITAAQETIASNSGTP